METPSTSRFECYVTNDESIRSAETFAFSPEEGKKSSFILTSTHEDATVFGIEAPAHVCIQAVSSDDNQCVPFVLGGFEIVSNSRNLEIYVSDENDKETYLTTCRGIKWRPEVSTNAPDNQQPPPEDNWHKALLVIPGGPRTMTRIRFKMLSIRPPSDTKSLVHYVKLKGRLPVVERVPSQPQPLHHVSNTSADAQFATTNASPPQQQPLSISDVAAALAGVSMMVHSTEERLTKVLESSLLQLNLGISNRLQGVERVVGMQWTAIQQLQQQNAIILQQQELMLHEMREQRSIHTQILESLTKLQLSNRLLQNETEVMECGTEDDDSKPPSRILGVNESEGIDALTLTGATINGGGIPHGETLDEENHSHVSSEARPSELSPAVDDEDSKPPLRARSLGSFVDHNVSLPIAEVAIEIPESQVDESTNDATIVGIEHADYAKEATDGGVEVTADFKNGIAVAEDDDSKPPSRARLDDDAHGSARRSLQDQGMPLPAIPIEPHPTREFVCSDADATAENDDEPKCRRRNADEDEKEEAMDIMHVASLGVDQAAYGDSDRPPSRSRQGEDQSVRLMLVLEPPDKGCGGPHEVVTSDPRIEEN